MTIRRAERADVPALREIYNDEVLGGVADIAIQRLTHQDVVRHELVQAIVRAYDAHQALAKEETSDGRIAQDGQGMA